MMPAWVWLVAAGALGAAELLTGTFYMLVLGAAALCGAAAAYLGASLTAQVLVAAIAAAVGCVLLWRHHAASRKASAEGASLDEGQRVEVEAWRADGTAEVRYRGTRWEAYAEEGSELKPGPWVIVRTEGPRLLVRPLRSLP